MPPRLSKLNLQRFVLSLGKENISILFIREIADFHFRPGLIQIPLLCNRPVSHLLKFTQMCFHPRPCRSGIRLCLKFLLHVLLHICKHRIPYLDFHRLVLFAVTVRQNMKTQHLFSQRLLRLFHLRLHTLNPTPHTTSCQQRGDTDSTHQTYNLPDTSAKTNLTLSIHM